MKKTLFILLIFLVFITGYFHFNKPQATQFKGVTGLRLVRISDEATELRGSLVFYNPNKMRAELGKVAFDVRLNGGVIGGIHDDFATAIKGGEEFHFGFQLRFPNEDVLDSSVVLPVVIAGHAGSDVLFANYTFPITYSGTVRNLRQ
jgi:hypothetical protein